MNLLLAAFLAAHGLIHASYLTPAPAPSPTGPAWPFALDRSWLVTSLGFDPGLVRLIGAGLVAATIGLLGAAALAANGWGVPIGWWPAITAAGAAASLLTLTLFFHPWLVFGLVIDATLLWAIFVAQWAPAARP